MKNVVITGTSRGIGFELARIFAANGFKVLAVSRNADPINALQNKNITTLAVDLSNQLDINRIKEFVSANWKSVDILINNAGSIVVKPFEKLGFDDFTKVFGVNVFSCAMLISDLLPHFSKQAHIVNISSIGGIQGSVKFPGLAAYSASKGALQVMTEVLAEEYKSTEMAFNCLALGAVQTEMLEEAFPGFKAPVEPAAMASYIYKFACEGNQFFNGKTLPVASTTP